MTSVLFVTWDGGGNVPPLLAIARRTRDRGAQVRVLGHGSQRAAVQAAGLDFEAYASARPWSVTAPRSGLRGDLAYAAVFADRGIGRDVIASLRRRPADRVVVDGLLLGAMTALHGAGIPYSILVHTVRSVMHRAVTGAPLGAVLRLLGHRPAARWAGAEAQLVAAEPTLDDGAGADAVDPRIHHLGAVLPQVAEARPRLLPVVLVSLSTTYVQGQVEVLQRVLDATAELPVRVELTTGPAVDPAALQARGDAAIHRVVPHVELMREATLVIGHGGHATTLLALAHGLPLLVIPMNPSFDQPAIGELIARRGLGLTLPRTTAADSIREAVERLLTEPGFAGAAREVGAVVRSRRAADRAADLLTGGTADPGGVAPRA